MPLRSPLPEDRKEVCEPLAQELKEHLLKWIESGEVSLREAGDIANCLSFAFSTLIRLAEKQGMEDMLDERLALEPKDPAKQQ